ncbi:lactosylceramide 1,3-N-acetyl-beta-D-glucosaminyltransferase-like [Styela clava]
MKVGNSLRARVSTTKLFGAMFLTCTFVCCIFLLIDVVPEQILHDVKAFLYYIIGFPTDMTVYRSKRYHVLQYSQIDWKYLINNPQRCENDSPFVIIFVKTHPNHFEERDIIRRTWGNTSVWTKSNDINKASIMFVLGLSKTHTPALQASLEKENMKYNDLIQENFVEDFHNLTIKLISHLKWPIKYCPNARYWMTTDDDVFVHVKNLLLFLQYSKRTLLYTGKVHAGSPRNTQQQSKYFVPYSVYRGTYYPSYCPGAGYVLSMDIVKKLHAEAELTPMLYIDDAYTGILARSVGVSPEHYNMFLGENMLSTDLCTMSMFLTSHGHKGHEMVSLFQKVISLLNLDPNVLCWDKIFSWIHPQDLVYF